MKFRFVLALVWSAIPSFVEMRSVILLVERLLELGQG